LLELAVALASAGVLACSVAVAFSKPAKGVWVPHLRRGFMRLRWERTPSPSQLLLLPLQLQLQLLLLLPLQLLLLLPLQLRLPLAVAVAVEVAVAVVSFTSSF